MKQMNLIGGFNGDDSKSLVICSFLSRRPMHFSTHLIFNRTNLVNYSLILCTLQSRVQRVLLAVGGAVDGRSFPRIGMVAVWHLIFPVLLRIVPSVLSEDNFHC